VALKGKTMKVELLKDYPGIGRKKGEKIDCSPAELPGLVRRGFVADQLNPSKPAKDTAVGSGG
jgi:hypothetical protein